MPATIDRRSLPAATASSMISAMKTEQCWPRETPWSAARARAGQAHDVAVIAANLLPCSSMNEPVPALQASFMAASTTRPLAKPDVLGVLAADLEDGVDPAS